MPINYCWFVNELGGTADWIYSGEAEDFHSPEVSLLTDGATYLYRAQSFDETVWEVGTGAYTLATGTFARTAVLFNSDGDTAKIDFDEPPHVVIQDYAIATEDYVDAAVADLQDQIDDNTTAIAKLTNNQFARVCRITSTQALTTNVLTKVEFNSVSFDPSGIWDATNFRFKPTVAGYYRHSWGVYASAPGVGVSYAASAKNGSRSAIGSFGPQAIDAASSGTDIVYLNGSTDYVETHVIHTGTSPVVNFSAAGDFSYSSIELVKAD